MTWAYRRVIPDSVAADCRGRQPGTPRARGGREPNRPSLLRTWPQRARFGSKCSPGSSCQFLSTVSSANAAHHMCVLRMSVAVAGFRTSHVRFGLEFVHPRIRARALRESLINPSLPRLASGRRLYTAAPTQALTVDVRSDGRWPICQSVASNVQNEGGHGPARSLVQRQRLKQYNCARTGRGGHRTSKSTSCSQLELFEYRERSRCSQDPTL